MGNMGKEVCIDGMGPVKLSKKVTYLGTQIGISTTVVGDAVSARITMASAAMARLRRVWTQRGIPIVKKLHLYESLVTSILLYGVDAHNLTNAHLQRIEAVQTRHLRRLGESPAHLTRESNEDLRKRLNFASVDVRLRIKRLLLWQRIFCDPEMVNVQAALLGKWSEDQGGTTTVADSRKETFRKDITWLWEEGKYQDERVFLFDGKGVIRLTREVWKWFLCLSEKKIKGGTSAMHRGAEKSKAPKDGPTLDLTFACGDCGKKFATQHSLTTHRFKSHDIRVPARQLHKGVKCLVCSKEFASVHGVRNHTQNVCWKKMSDPEKLTWLQKLDANEL
jgi:hypothetical protein